jgi:tRNA modification GTPase
LFVIDGSKPLSKQHFEINKLIALKKHLLVINKSDLKGVVKVNGIKISALKKQINPLIQIIKKNFKKIDLSSSHNLILQSKVSTEIFEHCLSKLLLANNLVVKKAQTDLVLQELHDALNNILELLGEKKDFNFINEMFKNFCLGK